MLIEGVCQVSVVLVFEFRCLFKVKCWTPVLTTALVDVDTNSARPHADRQYHQIVWLPDDDGTVVSPQKRADRSALGGAISDAGSSSVDVELHCLCWFTTNCDWRFLTHRLSATVR